MAAVSNAALLGGLSELVGSSKQTLARVLAHLGEVEERRLHLDMGYSSMFVYCVKRLGLSEDEACRRIEVSRLARRHPHLFARIASGRVSLSVAALLKPHLTEDNAAALLDLVSGSSVARAREQLAAHFPRPDVPATIRKLPKPRGAATPTAMGAAAAAEPEHTRQELSPGAPTERTVPRGNCETEPLLAREPKVLVATADASPCTTAGVSTASSVSRILEPLSKGRYKLQLTADTELKDKLELARDLMRHTQPDGDLAPILSRALDLLIEQLMKRRFGARSPQPRAARKSTPDTPDAARPTTPGTTQPNKASPATSRQIPRSTRRIVAERDGLRCAWHAPDGTRCEARAWLEADHHHPRGRGGDASPENIRLLCRAHNLRAAEKEYGREHIDRCIVRARHETAHPRA